MKKFLAIVMCLAMALSMMTVVSFAADLDPTVTASDVKIEETVTVTVSIPANEGITTGKIFFNYDNTKLEIVSADCGALANELSANINPEYAENIIALNWSTSSNTASCAGGEVLVVEFRAIEEGEATFSFSTYSFKKKFTTLASSTSVTKTITVKGDEPESSATIINAPTEAGPNGGVVKVLQAVNATEFGIKYVGTNAEYANATFKSLATGADVTAAVEVVGLDDAFEAYFVK